MRYQIKKPDVDLAADANHRHIAGTAYHWRHNYIPLDARTATQFGKKAAAKRLLEAGQVSVHEPDGVTHINSRGLRATRSLSLIPVHGSKPKPKVEAPTPVTPKVARASRVNAPSSDKETLVKRKAAADFAAALAPFGVKGGNHPYNQTEEQHAALDKALAHLKQTHPELTEGFTDAGLPSSWHLDGGHPFRKDKGYTYDKSVALRRWSETHLDNVKLLRAHFPDVPALKKSHSLSGQDLKSLASALRKDPAKEAAKEAKAHSLRRTDALEVLGEPKKGDTLRLTATKNPLTQETRPGDLFQHSGTLWRRMIEHEDSSLTPKNGSYGKRSNVEMRQYAAGMGISEVNGKSTSISSTEVQVARDAKKAATKDATFDDLRAAMQTPEKVSPALAKDLGRLSKPDSPEEAQASGYRLKMAETTTAINCQKATLAYELRRRGFDASANMGQGGPEFGTGFYSWFGITDKSDPRINKIVNGVNYLPGEQADERGARIHAHISKGITDLHPVGSRGSMIVMWTNPRNGRGKGRHIFNWEHTPQGLVFRDAQVNKEYGPDDRVWQHLHTPTPLEVFRTDDKAILTKGGTAVTSAPTHAEYLAKIKVAQDAVDAEKAKPYSEQDWNRLIELQKVLEAGKASAKRKFYKNLGKGGSEW